MIDILFVCVVWVGGWVTKGKKLTNTITMVRLIYYFKNPYFGINALQKLGFTSTKQN